MNAVTVSKIRIAYIIFSHFGIASGEGNSCPHLPHFLQPCKLSDLSENYNKDAIARLGRTDVFRRCDIPPA